MTIITNKAPLTRAEVEAMALQKLTLDGILQPTLNGAIKRPAHDKSAHLVPCKGTAHNILDDTYHTTYITVEVWYHPWRGWIAEW